MKWTNKQQEAIELRNHNMLVSAAAGSGKTAVLVERIKRLIMRDKIPVDSLLVVTFTNAAAGEMKDKIVKAITEEIEKNPKESHDLRRQLNTLYKANISTFHAFALTIIRRYFHVIHMEPNFKVCDEAEAKILQGEAVDKLIENLFDSDERGFIDFLNCYASGKNEDAIKKMILSTYSTLMSIPEPFNWLAENVDNLTMNEALFYDSHIFNFLKKDVEEGLKRAAFCYETTFQLLVDCGAVLLVEKCGRELHAINELQDALADGNFPLLIEKINHMPTERYVATKAEKENYEEIKETVKFLRNKGADSIKKIKSLYFAMPLSDCLEDIRNTSAQAKYLMHMVTAFDQLYKDAKAEKKLIDFSDIEHMALEILKDEQVAAEYREKFSYIFIDEYQDSNLIQDTLICRIKRDDNLFMVGDVKQSIYKFRLAEPEIFMEKYEQYKTLPDSRKIDLNMNFRSKRGIIEGINHIFAQIMDRYDEDAALYKGVSYEGPLSREIEVHLVDNAKVRSGELDDEIMDMKKAELEAHTAAEIIKSAIGQMIFDEKSGVLRPLTKKDIVILMRSTKNYADQYYQILMDKQIPVHIDTGDGYFDTLEIDIFLNLLRVIDNKRQDIPLLSVLRSAIFRFTIEEFIEIRIDRKKGTYYKAFADYSITGRDECLRHKCFDTLKQLAEWKELAAYIPLEDLIFRLMWDTGYYAYVGALPGGVQRQANLRVLVDKAVKFSAMQMSGIYGFIGYVDTLKERGIPMGQVSLVGENDDVVRIMTIHKSKGLEYPMVLVAGLGRKLNNRSDQSSVAIHKDIGIGLRYVNSEEHWFRKTLVQSVIERKMYMESMEEQVRVLYVAFTRAMDRLILLGAVENLEREVERYARLQPGDILSAGNYLDLIIPALPRSIVPVYHNRANVIPLAEEQNNGREKVRQIFEIDNHILKDCDQQISEAMFQEINRRLTFEYEHKRDLLIKSKYTVTELNEQGKADRVEFKKPLGVPKFAAERKGYTAAEKGTIMHTVLEHLDFKAAYRGGKEYLQNFITSLSDRLILFEEECQAIEIKKIEAFLNSDIGKRAAQSELLYKELPFNLLKEVDGVGVMVQGIIDCCFIEDGEYILLDYKTNYMISDSDAALELIAERYRNQLTVYKEALEVIKGVKVKESYLYLLSVDKAVKVL